MSNKEWEEQTLIKKGGIHPAPWDVVGGNNGYYVVDSNRDNVVPGPLLSSVAKAIVESYNRHPIVILEDDVVY